MDNKPSFEPILLDLVHDDDYYVLTEALRAFADEMDSQADDDDDMAKNMGWKTPSVEVAHFRQMSSRAKALIADVERQLEANGRARRPSAES